MSATGIAMSNAGCRSSVARQGNPVSSGSCSASRACYFNPSRPTGKGIFPSGIKRRVRSISITLAVRNNQNRHITWKIFRFLK
jgi:hypothetical protein